MVQSQDWREESNLRLPCLCDRVRFRSSLLPRGSDAILHRLEFTIWFIPSLIGNAVAVSLVGVMLGPMYPIVMSQAGRVIPRKVRVCKRYCLLKLKIHPLQKATYGFHWMDICIWRDWLSGDSLYDRSIGQQVWDPSSVTSVSTTRCTGPQRINLSI